ncbi:MAG: tetratricopeptide repeat protein, partial [Gemmatimonadaceae bacterium]
MTRAFAAALLGALLLGTSVASAQSRGAGSRTSAARNRAIRAELAEVLLQSKQYDDAAREYRALLYAEPDNRAYRLNLARALAWGRRFREAEGELRILASRQPGNPVVEALLVTVRKALTPSANEAAQWVEERPGSADYRRIFARALAREGRPDEALRQYDLLLPQQRSAELLLERAYLHVEQHNNSEAETDLFASIAMGPSVDALLMLGDLRRWRGDLGSAHKLYSHARSIAPASSDVAAAFARLARDERPAAAFIPQASDAPGWQTTSTTTADNLGALLTTVAMRRGFKAQRLDGSVGVKALRLSDHLVGGDDLPPIAGPGGVPDAGLGFGADVAISGEVAYRELYGR